MSKLDTLEAALHASLGDAVVTLVRDRDELTLTLKAVSYAHAMRLLRDEPALRFEQLIDLCGIDYGDWQNQPWEGPRYAAVVHLLSLTHNHRLRVRVFAPDDELPVLTSMTGLWSSVNWFEREAFDLYGIIFEGHLDLRRILTDYGFIGHPMRKDFPVSGHVEMRYDDESKRVIYQPVTIEPREVTPRVVREEHYGAPALMPGSRVLGGRPEN
ncbi:MAG: NADH-quinone oxidoreductase subunit C [Rubrivivax sp.]